jgi:hypothetical protein
MQTTQGGMLQSLRAVQVFLDENAEPLATVVKTGARGSSRSYLPDAEFYLQNAFFTWVTNSPYCPTAPRILPAVSLSTDAPRGIAIDVVAK